MGQCLEQYATDRFQADLVRWGPGGRACGGLDEAEAYCRGLARTRYENFPLLAWLLPRRLRQPLLTVYAWCRWADDLADEVADPGRSLELLAWWRGELEACFDGSPRHPVSVALQAVSRQFGLDRRPFDDLLSAFEQDQRVVEYETFADLLDYCRRSADPVGRIVLALCGTTGEQRLAQSDSICTGLQLANFWQDVRRDHEAGRVYLPREDRRRFGYDDDRLAGRVTDESFIELMRFEVDRAREYLLAGLPLVAALPGRMQTVVDLFARGGLAILRRIEQVGFGVWETRPVVRRRDKLGLVSGGLLRAGGRLLGGARAGAGAADE